jgi:four helix bundle protein
MKDFKDMDVWQFARKMTHDIYIATQTFPKSEIWGLTSQMQRSAVSVPSNIAEGLGRSSQKEALHFLHISRGSLFELETQLYIALDLHYIDNQNFENIHLQINSTKKLLNGLISYYKKQTTNQTP